MNTVQLANAIIEADGTSTGGPWAVHEHVVPIKGDRTATHYLVVTEWEHGQLKAPVQIAGQWLSIAPNGDAQRFVSFDKKDADAIVVFRQSPALARAYLQAVEHLKWAMNQLRKLPVTPNRDYHAEEKEDEIRAFLAATYEEIT